MKRLHPAITAVAIGTLGLLYLPMVGVAIFSVNRAPRHSFVWKGFTLDWYRRLADNQDVLAAAKNTLILAATSTAVSTVLGTLLALAIWRLPWPRWFRRLADLAIFLPVVTPDIVFAVAMVVAFGLLRQFWRVFEPGLPTMIIAHVTFQIAFVALVVGSRLATIGRAVEEAARDLYAGTWYVLRRVTLPLLAPGIVAGAMLAFTLSLDDFVISYFTSGPDSGTLPILIHSSVRKGISPEMDALSTLIFLVTVGLVLALQLLARSPKES